VASLDRSAVLGSLLVEGMSNCLLREAGIPMLDGVAGRGLTVRLDCKPNDHLNQRLG